MKIDYGTNRRIAGSIFHLNGWMGVMEKGVIGKDFYSKVTFDQGESNHPIGPSVKWAIQKEV